MEFPTPQGVHSTTFTPPAWKGLFGLHQAFEFHRKNSPNHPFCLFETAPSVTVTLNWAVVGRAIHRAARILSDAIASKTVSGLSDGPPRGVVAILASTDSLTYMIVIVSLMRAGYIPFPLSPRNSPAGIKNLLDATNATHILATPDEPTQTLLTTAVSETPADPHSASGFGVTILPLPRFSDVLPEPEPAFEEFPDRGSNDVLSPALILHSSGSTAFPKPHIFPHQHLIQCAQTCWFGEVDLCGEILAAHTTAFFHAGGLGAFAYPVGAGVILGLFSPHIASQPPTPERLLQGIVATKSTILMTVPSILESFSQEQETINTLSELKWVYYLGAPLDNKTIQKLIKSGVRLFCALGATEIGSAGKMKLKDPTPEGPEWIQFSPQTKPALLPTDEPGVFELAFLPCETHTPLLVNTEINGQEAYTTRDLIVQHPTNKTLWKIIGRADDQIMLSSGEKTNPAPIEAIINKHPLVKSAIMFGRGRFQNGILIEPHTPFDPSNPVRLSDLRNDIWPALQEANAFAPQHSRIYKEMIVVATADKPVEYSLKLTPRRDAVIRRFEPEIAAAYTAVEESSLSDMSPPNDWYQNETLNFVRAVVTRVLNRNVEDADDIFQRGCDSLQATTIRNAVTHALRHTSVAVARSVSSNCVYTHSTISSLASYISALGTNSDLNGATPTGISRLEKMVEKYSSCFPTHRLSNKYNSAHEGEVVLLTGSTGNLGSQIMAQLHDVATVRRIYALNRGSDSTNTLTNRQRVALEGHGLDPHLVDSTKVVLLEGDLTEREFGIGENLFGEIKTSVTSIIHCAWSVNFNITLTSFEPAVKGVRNLIDLALGSPHLFPPRLLFISSVGVLKNWNGTIPVPEAPIHDPQVPAGGGYAESKWVSERICEIASNKTPLRPIIIRVGQLSGGSNGSWNQKEWLPSIVRSGQILKCLPVSEGVVSWISVNAAAAAIIEMRNSAIEFAHLEHPRPVSWFSEMLGTPLVPYQEWLFKLEDSFKSSLASESDQARQNPALHLLDFYRGIVDVSKTRNTKISDALGAPKLSMVQTMRAASRSLSPAHLNPVGQGEVARWVEYWRQVGFLRD